MKAFYYPSFGTLEIADLPVPSIAPDEVLLRVDSCGICGSELETFKARSPRRTPPLVMGHEFCGTIAEVGPEVTGWQTGQKVVSNSLVPCGVCVRCQRGDTHLCKDRQIFGMHRPGAFAEYVNVPARALIPWPEHLPGEMACLAEPLGNGVHVVELVRHLKPRKALVIGAGPIGLMCQQALQVMLGVETVVSDLSPARTAVALRLGAVAVVDKEGVTQRYDGAGKDQESVTQRRKDAKVEQGDFTHKPAPERSDRGLGVAKEDVTQSHNGNSPPGPLSTGAEKGSGTLEALIAEWTQGEGVDVVVDAVGATATKKQSIACLRPGGAAVWIGLHGNEITFDSYDVTLPEKFVYGTYAAKMEDLVKAVELMADGKIETMSWVKTWPLEQSIEAFERMLAAQGDDIKAVIRT